MRYKAGQLWIDNKGVIAVIIRVDTEVRLLLLPCKEYYELDTMSISLVSMDGLVQRKSVRRYPNEAS